ncbi:hypothetical protein SESBI_00703 [Sesbania bispinosa]|nr:hypothetical protein SESBI_00703 [Sesbania bispinosa]
MAASMAIITTLCIRRKSSPPSSTLSDPLEVTNAFKASSSPSNNAEATTISPEHPHTSENNEVLIKELPLPPAMQQPKDSNIVKRATSECRLSFNLSIKVRRSMSVAKNWDHHKEEKKGGKVKGDESVWMKTIILGEKCVPGEEEDVVIYEGKGKKISAYHPKNSTSMSLSRQLSSIALDALSVPHEERINNI